MVNVKKLVLLFSMICSFTQLTADYTWSAPSTLSSLMVNSSDPRIATDTSGNATAVWVENGFVKASFMPVNGSWGAPATLSGSGASSPKLAVDGSGKVTAVWLESNGVLKLASLPLNGSWSASSSVSSSGASQPALAVNSSGNVAIVWKRSGFIEAATKVLGILSLVSTISPANSSNPCVAVGENGRVIAVWQTILGTGAATVESATQSSIGGIWGSAVNILPGASAFDMNYPVVSIDPNGNADVIWFRYLKTSGIYSNVFVYSATLPMASTSWSFPVQISDIGMGNPDELFIKIKTDAAGNKIAIWSLSFDGQSYVVESSGKLAGNAWTPFTILENQNLYAFQGSESSDSLGDATAVSMYFNGTTVDIHAQETSSWQTAGQIAWTALATLSSTGTNNTSPHVSVNNDPNTLTSFANAVWVSADGANTIIQAASGSKTVIAPPTNLAVTQNVTSYGVFNDYYNTLTWDSSVGPNLSQYIVFRDGLQIAQLEPFILEFIDHNATQNGTVTYSVTASDEQGALSVVANVTFP